MPYYQDWIVHSMTALTVPGVRLGVRPFGTCTFEFSQCKNPVNAHIMARPGTSGGICDALSAHWIKHHSGGGSMWSWLYPNDQLDLHRLDRVLALQAAGVADDAVQDRVTEAFLARCRVVPRQTNHIAIARQFGPRRVVRGLSVPTRVEGQSYVYNAFGLARAIAQETTLGEGCYKRISISGRGGAHSMAAWVAQDVMFFDPNYGEFWFETRARFISWFCTAFWYMSPYAAGLSGDYELRSYARLLPGR